MAGRRDPFDDPFFTSPFGGGGGDFFGSDMNSMFADSHRMFSQMHDNMRQMMRGMGGDDFTGPSLLTGGDPFQQHHPHRQHAPRIAQHASRPNRHASTTSIEEVEDDGMDDAASVRSYASSARSHARVDHPDGTYEHQREGGEGQLYQRQPQRGHADHAGRMQRMNMPPMQGMTSSSSFVSYSSSSNGDGPPIVKKMSRNTVRDGSGLERVTEKRWDSEQEAAMIRDGKRWGNDARIVTQQKLGRDGTVEQREELRGAIDDGNTFDERWNAAFTERSANHRNSGRIGEREHRNRLSDRPH
jgi:hypothetical protein